MVANIRLPIARLMQRRTRPLGVLGAISCLGIVLGACSKCDVPNLLPNNSRPLSCHDGPSPQSMNAPRRQIYDRQVYFG